MHRIGVREKELGTREFGSLVASLFSSFYFLTPVVRVNSVFSRWTNSGQHRSLSPAISFAPNSLWESLGSFAQKSPAAYTAFPTARSGKITPSGGYLSPRSTGPIKKTTKYIKEI